MSRSLLLVALVGCADPASGPPVVTGPFDGAPHRFVVDSITLPTTSDLARQLGADLDGDGSVDNQLGIALGLLASADDVTTHASDMIASGVLASSIIIRSDDLATDPHAGISYFGAGTDADLAFGGRFVDGTFRSNRAGSSAPGQAALRLPVFVDVDPLVVDTRALELDLTPDGTGYIGAVRGGIVAADVVPAITASMLAMLKADPNHHLAFARLLDADQNGTFSDAEIANNGLIHSLTVPDVHLGGELTLSFGFQIHLTPCASGTCTTTPPADTCDDRVLDGDETAVDCGGSCGPCPGGATCAVAGDCQSNACGAGLTCAAPSCTDTVTDGFESDTDCGGINCAGCATGKHCVADADCATTHCDGTTSTCSIYPP